MDTSHVYVGAWALGRFRHSLISTHTFRSALTASVDSCTEITHKECPFSGVTKSGRVWRKVPETMLGVWRKVPESDARSVEEGAGKPCSECGGRCRKAMLGVWRKMPESHARSVEEGAGKPCSECGGRCRKAMLGVWRKAPESHVRSVEEGAGKPCSECGGRCRKAMLGVWRKQTDRESSVTAPGSCTHPTH